MILNWFFGWLIPLALSITSLLISWKLLFYFNNSSWEYLNIKKGEASWDYFDDGINIKESGGNTRFYIGANDFLFNKMQFFDDKLVI